MVNSGLGDVPPVCVVEAGQLFPRHQVPQHQGPVMRRTQHLRVIVTELTARDGVVMTAEHPDAHL